MAKLASERYLYFYHCQYGLDATCLRYANVYGPRQNPHGEAGVVAIFLHRLLAAQQPVINGDGLQTRDYVFVGDVVSANLAALGRPGCNIYNVGTGIETDVNTLFANLHRAIGSGPAAVHGPGKAGEQLRSASSSALLGRGLGVPVAAPLAGSLPRGERHHRRSLRPRQPGPIRSRRRRHHDRRRESDPASVHRAALVEQDGGHLLEPSHARGRPRRDRRHPEPRDAGSQPALALGRCSYRQPQFCTFVSGLASQSRNTSASVRAGGNGRFGRRNFVWASVGDVALRYQKRNILGFSTDFAEDTTKSSWGVEFTWVDDSLTADNNEYDGLSHVDEYNLTLSVDRPTFINFLNANRTKGARRARVRGARVLREGLALLREGPRAR